MSRMRNVFEDDPFPGKTKILFVGDPVSTHVFSWIDLVAGDRFNVRFFALPPYPPPADWPVRTYLALPHPPPDLDPETRKLPWPARQQRIGESTYTYSLPGVEKWLAEIISYWRPDIIHVFGVDPAAFSFSEAMAHLDPRDRGFTWITQTRGGSDLTLARTDPATFSRTRSALEECDEIITDNRKNFEYLQDLGVSADKISEIAPVPGTGGIDIDAFAEARKTSPSMRERIILWPKAYESPWSKALPVLEAIRDAWEKIKPCTIYMLAMLASQPEVRQWFHALPEELRASCHIDERIPRDRLFALLKRTRVMFAPSLVDGIPNSMYEAMACGAFPIVSPLDTIRTAVKDEENVLFARNLYPGEMANALDRAMNDDRLVDAAALKNVDVLRTYADRASITARVVAHYRGLHERTEAERKRRAEEGLPLVTIITPARNQAEFLDETIRSVLCQDYPRCEYIIVDDGSEDDTREVVSKYGDQIRLESLEKTGEAGAINRGLQLSKGDIVCVVKADSPLLQHAVSTAVSFLSDRPGILVAYPDWYGLSDESRFLYLERTPDYDYLLMVSGHRCFVGPAAFMRRKAIDLVGGLDPRFEYRGDFDFWLRLGLHGPFAHIPKPLATLRVGASSPSAARQGRKKAKEGVRVIRKAFSLPGFPEEAKKARAKAFSAAHLNASRLSGQGRLSRVFHYLMHILYDPRGFLGDRDKLIGLGASIMSPIRQKLSNMLSPALPKER